MNIVRVSHQGEGLSEYVAVLCMWCKGATPKANGKSFSSALAQSHDMFEYASYTPTDLPVCCCCCCFWKNGAGRPRLPACVKQLRCTYEEKVGA